jgi:mono/diheme cytochrome c family protein
MMRRWSSSLLVIASLALALMAASAQESGAPKPSKRTHASAERGEQLFQQNCVRCHTPPQQLSPRVARTVMRHMRVRAQLSDEDVRDILAFLNPQ